MTPRYTIHPAADRDLDDQAAYLHETAGLEPGLRFYDAAAETFAFLARSPGLGAPRASTNPLFKGIRVWRVVGFPNHLVFYRAVADGIEIVRLLHGRRDLDSLLGPEADPAD